MSDKKLDLILSELKYIKTDVSELKTDVSELKTDVSKLKKSVSKLETDVSGLKTDVSSLKTTVNRIDNNVADIRYDMDKCFENVYQSLVQAFERISDNIQEKEKIDTIFNFLNKVNNKPKFKSYPRTIHKEELIA